jgi:2OG-Fe(II) oxygenase superfamily
MQEPTGEPRALRSEPWPHLLIDDFLPPEVLRQCLSEIDSENYEFEIESRGTGRIEFSLLKSETLWRAIYSKKTVALLRSAFRSKVALNKHNMVQLRRMNSETPDFPRHSDFVVGSNTIASFLYLSPGWSPQCGGYFHFFTSEEQLAPALSIAPVQNRFLAFRTKRAHWHAVACVSNWERLSALALWDVDETRDS